MPIIRLNASELKQTTEFLIDTGAEINLIHLQTLKPKTMIATHESMAITGITEDSFNTLESTEITFFDTPIKFQVIKHNLPLGVTGILGVDFLKTENAEVSFHHNTLVTSSRPTKPIRFINYKAGPPAKYAILARSKTPITIKLQPTELYNRLFTPVKNPSQCFYRRCLSNKSYIILYNK